ncbi:unnamed protein product [Urochloa decumbens]|uniref:F-box domain-containing protein n=1 Tax=Urochloa decumbens TaxID=240449 RepID=A0ABC8XX74_9POAL
MPRSHRHPLAESVDARRWDAEAPLGRIFLVAHAAFLHAGFVSYAGKPASHRPVPKQVGLTASTLPFRYTIPELVVRARRDAPVADAAVLRLCAHGDFLILYGYLASGGRRPGTRWACVDPRLVAPALSGDLDAAARALAGGDSDGDALGARWLWNALADGLARWLFLDIWARNVAFLPPRLTPLPADLQAEILAWLAAADLAMVECTCRGLRDLVAARELWKARYMAERRRLLSSVRSEIDGSNRSWKEKYVATRLLLPSSRWRRQLRPWWWFVGEYLPLSLEDLRYAHAHGIAQRELDRFEGQDPTERLIRRFLERKSKVPVGDGDGHRRRATAMYGNGQRRCSEEAVYSPSARYGRTHR